MFGSLSLPAPAARKWASAALLTLALLLQGLGLSATAPSAGRAAGIGETPTSLMLTTPTKETES